MVDYGKMSKSQLLNKYGSFIKKNFGKKELDFVKGEDTGGVRKYIQDLDPEPVKKKDGGLMEAIEKVKAQGMELGGEAVPSKFKGFSKLPEEVQEKMDPKLATKFEFGGDVKGKKGRMMCRGMGIARKNKGFKIT